MDKTFFSASTFKLKEEDEAVIHMHKQEESNTEATKAAKLDQEKRTMK